MERNLSRPLARRLERATNAICKSASCSGCRSDQAYLRRKRRRRQPDGPVVRVVDLFAGCGAMSAGLEEAARRIGRRLKVRLAVDVDKTAIDVYRANLPVADARAADVAALFSGELGAAAT